MGWTSKQTAFQYICGVRDEETKAKPNESLGKAQFITITTDRLTSERSVHYRNGGVVLHKGPFYEAQTNEQLAEVQTLQGCRECSLFSLKILVFFSRIILMLLC